MKGLYERREALYEAVEYLKKTEDALDDIMSAAADDLRWIRSQVEEEASQYDESEKETI